MKNDVDSFDIISFTLGAITGSTLAVLLLASYGAPSLNQYRLRAKHNDTCVVASSVDRSAQDLYIRCYGTFETADKVAKTLNNELSEVRMDQAQKK